jgi:hypothetical protein
LQLPVCEQLYRDIVYIGEEQKILFFKTMDKRLLFSIDIRVTAGIRSADLINVETAGISGEGRPQVKVTVPDAEILLIDADEDTIEQFFIKEWRGRISRLEYYDEINSKKVEIKDTAIASGILKRADANAEQLVRNFLSLSGIELIEYTKAGNEI